MTVRYVGPGGSDSADGLTWANRKLTLNGVEDSPVVAGDVVYVGPGVYREQLIVDVTGSSGNNIHYIGDVTGAYTDGIGGVVRVTGSDDDEGDLVRNYCVYSVAHSYRSFTGFAFDGALVNAVRCESGSLDWLIEDCYFGISDSSGSDIYFYWVTTGVVTVRRCIFMGGMSDFSIDFYSSAVNMNGSVIENCLFYGGGNGEARGIDIDSETNLLVRNCTFIGLERVIASDGSSNSMYNCVVMGVSYKAIYNATFDYLLISPETYTIGDNPGSYIYQRFIGWRFPQLNLGGLIGPMSPVEIFNMGPTNNRMTDNGNAPDHDLFGLPRPATNGKRTYGCIQYQGLFQEDTIVKTGSYSLGLDDAGCAQFKIPSMHTKVTISVYVYRGVDYTGTLPQMVIKRPGLSDVTITDTGSSGQWNLLTTDVVVGEKTKWFAVQLKSNNAASAGAKQVYFDDLQVG